MAYYEQFKKHIDGNNLPVAVSLWQEYCMSDEVDPKEMRFMLEVVKESPLVDAFGEYVEDGLALWKDLPESRDKAEVLKLIFDLQTTNSASYAEIANSYLKEKYGMIDIFTELLKITGLRDGDDFRGCIRNFELLIHLQKGNFCFHAGSWGVGEVMDISFLRREVSVEFENVSDTKDISFTNAFKILTPMSSEHFLARRFGDPEKFEAFAKLNPIDSIKLLLRDLGDKTAFEIREEMEGLVIPDEEWTKWWSSVRGKLKKDIEIIYPGSLKEPFRLNMKGLTHEDRIKISMEKAKSTDELIDILYLFLRDFATVAKEENLAQFLKNEIAEVLFNQSLTAAEELQLFFLLGDLQDDQEKNITEMVKKLPSIVHVVEEIKILSYKRRLLGYVRSQREDWLEIFCEMIVSSDKHALRDFLYEEILVSKKEAELTDQLHRLVVDPCSSPLAFLWLFGKIMKEKMALFGAGKELVRCFEAFFVVFYHVENVLKDRALTKKMYGMVTEKRFEIVRRIFKGASKEEVFELLLLASKCMVFSDHDRSVLKSLAAVVHPELDSSVPEQEDVIWSTKEGLEKVRDRIEQIATKEVIENAKEIEIARAHGDLRENSEYKFAQEKRASLQKEMKNLSAQVKKVRVLSSQDVDLTKVSVGTKVTIESAGGEKKVYSILGPFDADTEKGIISFQSKLAKDLMDKKVGEKVAMNNTTWEIKQIAGAL